jgi:chaperonin GroES
MSSAIQPLFDNVLIKRKEVSKQTASGLILPTDSIDKLNQGYVKAVGTGLRSETGNNIPSQVQEGDLVVFGKFSGSTVTINGEELLIVQEKEILGIIK